MLVYGSQIALNAAKAGRKAKIERIVVLISELPAGGTDSGALRAIGRTLDLADAAVFHNGDDPKTLKKMGLLPGDVPYVIVPGAGVDLVRHGLQPLPALTDGLVFLMIARLDTQKGVLDFCQAARAIKQSAPSARFRLAGPPCGGKSGLTAAAIEPYRDCV